MVANVAFVVCLVSVALTAVTSASRGGGSHRNGREPIVVSAAEGAERPIKYENFDDYLRNIGNEVIKATVTPHHAPGPDPRHPVGDVEDNSESGDGKNDDRTDDTEAESPDERRPDPPSPAYDLDILGYFRDVPRQHWSCCMLGKLAGDKGFHCYAGFYAARIQARNRNRAHNKKMHFHGHDAIPDYGTEIMHTFQRCVATHGDEFHKCCYAATIERRERHKWSTYVAQAQAERQGEMEEELEEERDEERSEAHEDRSRMGRRHGQHQHPHHQQQPQHGHHGLSNRPIHHTPRAA